MIIKHQQPPDESLRELKDTAETMPREYSQIANMLNRVHNRPEEHWPHPVYVVGLKAMAAEDEGLKGARLAGWRFLVKSDGDRNHAVEVQQDDDGSDFRFSELDKGPFIEGMRSLLEDKNLDQKIEADNLNLSVLRINTMGVFAVWLQSDKPEKELIIPISPTPPCLKPWPQTYTVEQFQAALRDEAKRELEAEEFFDA